MISRRHLIVSSLVAFSAAVLLFSAAGCRQQGVHRADTSGLTFESDSAERSFWLDSCYNVYSWMNDFFAESQTDSLERYLPGALQLCEEHGQMDYYYLIWSLLAEEYVWDDHFDKAVAEAQKMQDDAIRRKNDYGMFTSYYVLGIGYGHDENNAEAVKFLRKAIDAHPSDHPNQSYLIFAYSRYVMVLNVLSRYEEADTALVQWKKVLDRVGKTRDLQDPWVVANWYYYYYLALSAFYLGREDYQKASAMVDSTEYYEHLEGDIPVNLMSVYNYRSQVALGQGNYQEALDYSERLKTIADELNENSQQLNVMENQRQAYAGLGRYKEAYEMSVKRQAMKDSLDEISNREQLNELNKRFEVNELKIAGERQQMQAERRQLYFVIAIILIVMLAIVLFAWFRRRADRRMAKLRAAKERMEGELQIARDIQMSMVPSEFPQYEGLDMFASMSPAKEVGGDLYGYVFSPQSSLFNGPCLYFCVGDVSGKGVPASLFMAQAMRLFQTMARQQMMPADICTRMNDALSGDDNASGMFVTFWLGLLDLSTGHLHFCNAGHNPPVIGGGDHHGVFLDMIPNAPIGLFPGLEYEGEQIESIKGRPLFVYTDGLNEAENPFQEQFGDDRLLDILRHTSFDSARQVIETLTAEVETHRAGADPNDDLTMLCLRVN